MEFYTRLKEILFCENPEQKLNLFNDFWSDFKSNKLKKDEEAPIILQNIPSYAKMCQIVHPTKIKRPKLLNSDKALASTLHQITHIEYSAIDLALDAAYRFRNLPDEFYEHFIQIAKEECKHFTNLNLALNELGYKYGDFSVHQNLFDAMISTSSSAKDRMGLVHRAMEASGLDANPFVVNKLLTTNHPIKTKLKEVMDMILQDEIGHVGRGNEWFFYLGGTQKYFIELLKKYKTLAPFPKQINKEARLKSGYTIEELQTLSKEFQDTKG